MNRIFSLISCINYLNCRNIAITMPIIPQYKLTYFNMMGRAEPIRLIFAQANVNYQDIRLDREQFAAIKQSN